MELQLSFDLLADATKRPSIHFRDSDQVSQAVAEISAQNVALFDIDGNAVHSMPDLFREFAIAFRKPKGWYGEEDFAPNANAFLEYLDDVLQWVPADHHIVVIRRASSLWRNHPEIAGKLVELWQFATIPRAANIHLVFAW
jgi:barstar (barnase inhibitor)